MKNGRKEGALEAREERTDKKLKKKNRNGERKMAGENEEEKEKGRISE